MAKWGVTISHHSMSLVCPISCLATMSPRSMTGADFVLPGLTEEGIDLKTCLSEMERRLIVQALDLSGGVVAKAAKLLNLQRTTLVEKMRKQGLERSD
jgi:transcriptional regulator with GAF, ATPase, and Fis domain